MDKEVLDFQKTVINGLKENYFDWNIKVQDNDTCNIILQVIQMMGGKEQSICRICMSSIKTKN